MSGLELRVPRLRDMAYRRALLGQPETMRYNAGLELDAEGYDRQTGCIDFPPSDWRYWREFWLLNEPTSYAALIYDPAQDCFVGEVCYYFDAESGQHYTGVVIEAKHRGKGFGTEALRLLAAHAFRQPEAEALFVELPEKRDDAVRMYLTAGYREQFVRDGVCRLCLTREAYEEENK